MLVKLAQFKSALHGNVHYSTDTLAPYLSEDMVRTSEFIEVDFPLLPPNHQQRRDVLTKAEANLRRQLAEVEAERAKLDQPGSV